MNEKYESPKGIDLFCENIVNTKFEDLSEDNIRIFKDRLFDMVGCIFGGAIVDENDFLEARYRDWGGKPEAPVFASDGLKLPLPNAAMLNAIKARSNDYGSMLFKVMGDAMPSHMGETLIPMGLTLADHFGVSGKELIANDVAGEDIAGRLLYSLPVRWPVDMLLVSSAAAAVASRYYKLDAAQTKAALSFAATNCTDPANSYFDYSQEVYLHNGVSARAGIMCAEYAKGGWKGLEDPYYGNGGLIAQRVEGGNYPELYDKIFDDLGKVYYTETAFKYSPGGIPMTAASLAGQQVHQMLIDKYGKVEPENIKAVRFYGAKNIYHGYYSNPFTLRNHLNALFAYRFAVTCSAIYGTVSVKTVQTSAIEADTELVRLAEGATMEIYEPGDGVPKVKVVLEMKDGSELEAEQNFMVMERYPEKEELIAKFMDQFNSYGKLPEANADKIIDLAFRIEELEDIREFTDLLYVK